MVNRGRSESKEINISGLARVGPVKLSSRGPRNA